MSIKRIGIPAHGFMDWGGGVDFLALIADSLRQARSDVELHAFMPCEGPLSSLRTLRNRARAIVNQHAISSHTPPIEHIERVFAEADAAIHRIDFGMRALTRACESQGIDALVPTIAPLSSGCPPWVGYIYDFQHRRLPQFFSDAERARRDANFARMLNSARAVIVNAQDVATDIEQYHPGSRARVFALPFSPSPARDAFTVDVNEACRRHGVTSPYFIICNQFWRHKDHGTAFRAFATIAKRHPDLLLVCTGATGDYRFPGYFNDLMRQAAHDGVSSRIRVLGMIPKSDQLALVRGAIALIQPTLFEGGPGGGAVYDAVAVGQQVILSDIPVNREISEPMIRFFRLGDDKSLALELEMAIGLATAGTKTTDFHWLRDRARERRRASGQTLMHALAYANQDRAF